VLVAVDQAGRPTPSAGMSATPPAARRRFKVVCPHDCPDTCVMTVDVEDGSAVSLGGDPDHRMTQGFLCAKVNRYLDRSTARADPPPAAARRRQGRGPLRAHLVGRGARYHRDGLPPRHRGARPAERCCPTRTPGTWGCCPSAAWIGASSTVLGRACSTARSGRRGGRRLQGHDRALARAGPEA